jgi:hypothetical protein
MAANAKSSADREIVITRLIAAPPPGGAEITRRHP